jgi:molecular chaperone DnaK (HSP70)
MTLLEEPQAAFYAWIHQEKEKWRKEVKIGESILVCDVGGGTTDFSLIRVTEEGGELVLKRMAVGDHLLLGGDNMDLALAYTLQAKLARKERETRCLAVPWSVVQLQGCQRETPGRCRVGIPSRW